jgi:hypothetical protein
VLTTSPQFVVDGDWKHDPTGKHETDDEGNVNNVIPLEDIKPPNSAAAILSSVAPGATTTAMAGEQPLENGKAKGGDEKDLSAPGAFPETPSEAAENQNFSVNPIPVTDTTNPVKLAPGEKVPDPASLTNNTLTSQVHDDPELKAADEEKAAKEKEGEQTVGISPLPATGGIGNPIQLAPGESVPDPTSVTGNTLTSNVKLDKESYEKSNAAAPFLPVYSNAQGEQEAAGTSPILGGLGPQTTNMIPESSMPMGKDAPAPIDEKDLGPNISSVAPQSTTNELAGQVPLESNRPPAIVSESQQEAGAEAEASANPTAVAEKSEVENELQEKVPEAPVTSESTDDKKTDGVAGAVAGGLAGAGAAAGAAAMAARDKTAEATGKDPVSVLPESVQDSIDGMNKKADESKPTAPVDHARDTTETVPEEVVASQKEAHVEPEATANPEAVQEKKAVEKELLKKVPESEAQGEPAPAAAAALSETAPAPPALAETSASGAPQLADPTSGVAALSMDDKPVEGSKELNAPAGAPAVAPAEKVNQLAAQAKDEESRDVSPMTKPAADVNAEDTKKQDQPTVTSGVDSAKTASQSKPVGTPRKANAENTTPNKRTSIIDRFRSTPESSKSPEGEGKEKKKGFFSKLKEKLK